ncbi:Enigma [Carabus blaptoides fortunei]
MRLLVQSRLRYIKQLNTAANNVRLLSTQTQVLPTEYESIHVPVRVIKKRPQKPPFMKNIFVGTFDPDILGFPEVLDKAELNTLNDKVSEFSNYFNKLDPVSLSQCTKLPESVRQELMKLNVFGLQTSKLIDGLELNETENCRLLEVISQYSSIAVSVINHQYLGVNAITKSASDRLVNKYLPQLSKGEKIAAFCILEENNQDPTLMKTHATLSSDGKHWILNGTKSFVVNGSQGDVFIVIVNTHDDGSATSQDRLSVLVVEKEFGGITCTPCQPVGFKGADICNVTFDNTHVPIENILGEGADSIKVITPLLSRLRLSTGPACIALIQKLIQQFSKHVVHTKHGQTYLSDTDFVRDKIAQINLHMYAVESMTYMTAGLLDRYEEQDCDLESTIVKVFSSEACLQSIMECVKMVGVPAYMEGHWLNSLYSDALGHIVLSETNDSLRMVIALSGLQHAGMELNDNVKKLRNPFFFPGYVVKKMFEQRRQAADDPKLNLDLEGYLHPSLTLSARWLEYCVLRLQYATESMLIRHGPQVVEQHMELKKLADVAMDVYAMISVLSRASRAYCIGLQNADYEILLANAYCLDARERVKQKVLEISRGPYATNDINYQKLAKRALKFNGYFAEHALTKNF